MATSRKRVRKCFRLDALKFKRAQKAFNTKTETGAIEHALDFAVSEHERNRIADKANKRFISSRIEIKDVYGNLDN